MDKYVRFVSDRVAADSNQTIGFFQQAYDLEQGDQISTADLRELRKLLGWFAKHLKTPSRFSRSSRSNSEPKAICWFKPTSVDHISKARRIIEILAIYGVDATMKTTTRPGYIVFEDDHQIAAVPFTRENA